MDFTKTEAAQDLSGLVRTIVDSVCTPDHQRRLDGLDQRFDEELWEKLIHADILSTAAPENVGGGGFGVLEQTAILSGLGRQIAAVPYLESVVLGAGALSRFGTEEQRRDWGAPAVAGAAARRLDLREPAQPEEQLLRQRRGAESRRGAA